MSEYKADSVRSHKFTENKRSNMIPCGNKFVRRHDLTPSIRLYVAFMAISARATGTWGKITETVTTVYDFPHVCLYVGQYVTRNKFGCFWKERTHPCHSRRTAISLHAISEVRGQMQYWNNLHNHETLRDI